MDCRKHRRGTCTHAGENLPVNTAKEGQRSSINNLEDRIKNCGYIRIKDRAIIYIRRSCKFAGRSPWNYANIEMILFRSTKWGFILRTIKLFYLPCHICILSHFLSSRLNFLLNLRKKIAKSKTSFLSFGYRPSSIDFAFYKFTSLNIRLLFTA